MRGVLATASLLVVLLALPGTGAAEPLPDSYLSTEIGPCRVSAPARNAGVARELAPICKESYAEILAQLGQKDLPATGSVEVRIAPSPEAMRPLAPKGAPPPAWADAVAFPEANLVVLSLRHRDGSPVLDLPTVLKHELSHLALRKATGAALPRWFSEGVAIHQSERSTLGRYWFLWTAVQGERLLPLGAIDRYPERSAEIDLAYAEAADFMAFLLRRDGWLGVRVALRQTARGKPFDAAFAEAFGDSPAALEAAWLKGLYRSWRWAPVLTGTGLVWGFITALFLVAYAIVRRREKRRLRDMEEEERRADLALLGAPEEPGSQDAPRTPEPPRAGPSAKIRIDGNIYTLH